MLRISILAFAVTLGGCSTTYYRDGSTEEDFYRDQGQCKAQSMSGGFIGGMLGAAREAQIFQACMQGKGWRTKP